jgi:hypothetical protein
MLPTPQAFLPNMLGRSQLSGWGRTALRLLLVVGLDAPDSNGFVSYVVREWVMNFMLCLSVVVSRCRVSCMLSCLKHLGDGHTFPQQT